MVWIAAVKSATIRASIGQVGVVVLARDHLRITRGILVSLADVSPGFFSLSIGYRKGASFVTTGIVFQITTYLSSVTISPSLSNIYDLCHSRMVVQYINSGPIGESHKEVFTA